MFIMNPDSVTVIALLNTLNHTKMYHKETLFFFVLIVGLRNMSY